MSIRIDTAAFSAALEKRKQALLEAVRPAAQAGAEFVYQEARTRCPVSAEAHIFHGSSYRKTGTRYLFYPGDLRKAIYQVYSKDKSGPATAVYHVSWNSKKAPYGYMVEYGTSRAAAHPFMRPAIIAAEPRALEAMRVEFIRRAGA